MQRMKEFGYSPEVLLGKNHSLPFEDGFADYVLAAYCSYYCDEGTTMEDNIKEYSRILKSGAWLVTCIMHKDAEYLKGAQCMGDGTYVITNESNVYNELVGYRVYAVKSHERLVTDFSPYFCDFSFGEENHDFYGVKLRVIWMTCKRK
jgi:ubiquinone/menaquinone biosynthesis C-methylase UbiE